LDDEPVTELPTRGEIRAELERARLEFRNLVQRSAPEDLARASNGTRWSNRELLFHMVFGYLITRNLRYLVKIISRSPRPVQRGFAAVLNRATRPFHVINYWGSRIGGRALTPARMVRWSDWVIASLQRALDAETDASMRRSMAFPTRWDPYFKPRMALCDVYHYATLHFDHHRRQLAPPA
jgi:hypothetical protein